MHFRTLELFGFKSFPEKIEFTFEPGITAVVGPNGCGKTNVADAIRWVVGEQSPSSLRASRMDDVIFNGTAERKPLGYAEVSLSLVNPDGSLPIDYEEVMVTRRLFRTGESEYLINGAPCRLKDISDLFMDTGIGTASYSILAQGKVDLVLSSKPEDRRYLFEEAAGIMKYRMRKKEALRKLEATDQNLLRLKDILAEVKRQMAFLKRQAAKAERYNAERTVLVEMETRLGLASFYRLGGEIAEAQEKVRGLRAYLERMNTETMLFEVRLEDSRAKATEADRKAGELQRSMLSTSNELGSVDRDIALAAQRRDTLMDSVKRACVEIMQVEAGLKKTVDDIESASRQVEGLSAERALKEEEACASESRLLRLDEAIAKEKAGAEEARRRVVDAAAEEARARGELADARVVREKVEDRRRRLTLERARSEQEKSSAEEKLSAITGTLEKSLLGLRELREGSSTMRGELSAVAHTVQQLGQGIDRERQEMKEVEARLKLLEEQQRKFDGYDSGVKAVMEARETMLRGVYGPLAELIHLPQELEIAAEVALGPELQALVVEKEEDAEAAIRFLKETGTGRATFYAVECFGPETYGSGRCGVRDEPGLLGDMGELVRTDTRFAPLVKHLLGRTLVARDLASARKLRAGSGEHVIVTLDGEMLGFFGRLTGGYAQSGSVGLLRRAERIQECERSVEALGIEIGEHEAERALAREKLTTLQLELDKVEQDVREKEISVHRLEAEQVSSREQLARVEELLDVVSVEWSETEEELGELRERESSCGVRLAAAEREKGELESSIVRSEEGIETARVSKDEVARTLGCLRIDLSALVEREHAIRTEVGRLERTREEESRRRDGILGEVASSEEEIREIVKEEGVLTARHKELATRLTLEEQQLAEAERERRVVLEEIRAQEEAVRGVRDKSSSTQSELTGAELVVSEVLHSRRSLSDRLKVEYGLELESVAKDRGPEAGMDEERMRGEVARLKERLEAIGPVNQTAITETRELEERERFLLAQVQDLAAARDSLEKTIARISQTTKSLFMETFEKIRSSFSTIFRELFGGGKADLMLSDEASVLECGIEIVAQPPGKQLQSIALLSGGERALVATALLFAIFRVRPSPFCVLDEIDAALDDANIGRFVAMLKTFARESQFIIITHSKRTIGAADVIYGVTMEECGVSKLVSVRMAAPELRGNSESETGGRVAEITTVA